MYIFNWNLTLLVELDINNVEFYLNFLKKIK